MIESSLLPSTQGLIAGSWTGADSGADFEVVNPADGSLLARVPRMSAGEARSAVEAAQKASLSPSTFAERKAWLTALGDQLLATKDELGRIITLEHGKPLREGVVETEYAAGFFHFYADQVDRLECHTLPEAIRGCRWQIHLRPAGVAGLITPWNFPLAMIAKKMAPALAAGCAMAIKPASLTPLSAIALCRLGEQVGIRAGMVNLVIGDSGPIGETFCRHPAVRIVSFTGSTEVGKKLAASAAPYMKRLAMELGGNAPFIVFDDADLDVAADALMANKFRSGGQTCVCANRVYVHRAVRERFTEAVVAKVQQLKVGNGLERDTDIGPLVNLSGWEKVHGHVQDALQRGAKRLAGVDPPRPQADWGCYYPPTVLGDVRPDMLVCRDETFGPVVAISEFGSETEVLDEANRTEYGLAAYLFTADRQRVERCRTALQFGHLGVNTGTGPAPQAPFGGMKFSGYGREGGLEGLMEFCEPQVVAAG